MAFVEWASPGPRHILIQDALESRWIGDIERVVGMTPHSSRVLQIRWRYSSVFLNTCRKLLFSELFGVVFQSYLAQCWVGRLQT
jgi:hypothetical protein